MKFLGFLITCHGIEANPKKIQALLSLKEPKNLHDVQVLTGKMASMYRFLVKYTEKAPSFFKILKGSHPKEKFIGPKNADKHLKN